MKLASALKMLAVAVVVAVGVGQVAQARMLYSQNFEPARSAAARQQRRLADSATSTTSVAPVGRPKGRWRRWRLASSQVSTRMA